MLFLIGLELEPKALWNMRHRLLGLGGLQITITTLALMAGAIILGQVWSVSLAIGLIFALSSTAIVLQTLSEKRPHADRRRAVCIFRSANPGHCGDPDAGALASGCFTQNT